MSQMTFIHIHFPLNSWFLGIFRQWFHVLESPRGQRCSNISIFIWKPNGCQNTTEDEKEKCWRVNRREIADILGWWRAYKQMPNGNSSAQQQIALCDCALSLMHSILFFCHVDGVPEKRFSGSRRYLPCQLFCMSFYCSQKANRKCMQCVHSVNEWKNNSCYCLVVECAFKLWCGDLTDFGAFHLSTQQQYE